MVHFEFIGLLSASEYKRYLKIFSEYFMNI